MKSVAIAVLRVVDKPLAHVYLSIFWQIYSKQVGLVVRYNGE